MDININAQNDLKNNHVRATRDASLAVTRRSTNPLHTVNVIYYLSSDGREYAKAIGILHATTEKVFPIFLVTLLHFTV